MTHYYLLWKKGKLYRTTSDVWAKYAKATGYKEAGHVDGKRMSIECNGGLLSLTKEQRAQIKVENGI